MTLLSEREKRPKPGAAAETTAALSWQVTGKGLLREEGGWARRTWEPGEGQVGGVPPGGFRILGRALRAGERGKDDPRDNSVSQLWFSLASLFLDLLPSGHTAISVSQMPLLSPPVHGSLHHMSLHVRTRVSFLIHLTVKTQGH